MKFEIKHRFLGEILFTAAVGSLKACLELAVKNKAYLCGADLCGADLRSADLRGADLSGADLRGADLRGADLSGADLSGADLRSADLRGADLCGADLCGADLRSADLRGADLSGADLRGADLSGAGLDKKYVQISCIGSAKRLTTYCVDDDKIWCGCFSGTLQEFEEQIEKTHKDNTIFLAEYRAAVIFFKTIIETVKQQRCQDE